MTLAKCFCCSSVVTHQWKHITPVGELAYARRVTEPRRGKNPDFLKLRFAMIILGAWSLLIKICSGGCKERTPVQKVRGEVENLNKTRIFAEKLPEKQDFFRTLYINKKIYSQKTKNALLLLILRFLDYKFTFVKVRVSSFYLKKFPEIFSRRPGQTGVYLLWLFLQLNYTFAKRFPLLRLEKSKEYETRKKDRQPLVFLRKPKMPFSVTQSRR